MAEVSSWSSRSNWTATWPSTFFSTSNQLQRTWVRSSASARTRKVFVLKTRTALASNPLGSRNSSSTCSRRTGRPSSPSASAQTGMPPRSPSALGATSTITARALLDEVPEQRRVDGGAQVVEVGDPHVPAAPRRRTRRGGPSAGARRADRRGQASTCSAARRCRAAAAPSRVRRSPRSCMNVATWAGRLALLRAPRAIGASVASLVMSHKGTGTPARAVQTAFSLRRRSRKVCPSQASTSALTTPPMRVAMPAGQHAERDLAARGSPRDRPPRAGVLREFPAPGLRRRPRVAAARRGPGRGCGPRRRARPCSRRRSRARRAALRARRGARGRTRRSRGGRAARRASSQFRAAKPLRRLDLPRARSREGARSRPWW